MIGRRALLAGSAVVVVAGGAIGAERAGVLDDALRATGLDPVPQPDPADERLLADIRTSLSGLVLLADAQDAAVADLVREQLDVLGGADAAATRPNGSLAAALAERADVLGTASLAAVSPDLAQVLASASAGLLQARSAR